MSGMRAGRFVWGGWGWGGEDEDFWTRSEDERRQQLITELELVSPVTDQEIINNSSLLLVDVINSFDEVSFPS